MVDVAESSEDPWAAASAPADPFVAAAPGSPTIPVSPSRPTDQDPWGTPAASSDPWIETPTSPSAPADAFAAPPADPFEAATGSSPTAPSPALPARTEGSPSVSVPPDNTPADPWSQQPPAPAAEAPGGTPATGARKLRKKLAALTGMHHAGERASKAASKAKEKAKEKLAKKKETAAPPAEPAWSAGNEAPTDDAGIAIPAAHDVSPAAARPASLRLRKAAAKMTGMHGAFSPRSAQPDETDEQRAAAQAFDAMDADGDGEVDAPELIVEVSGDGEHGSHAVVLHPDGESLLFVCGNHTPLPESLTESVNSLDTNAVD